jgi:hypothetical protein
MKKHFYLVCDIETANHAEDALAYDVGLAIIDRNGTVYEKHSFICKEIFFDEADLMRSAYYANKIPEYYKGISDGSRKVATLYEIRAKVFEMYEFWHFKAIMAYNAYFDNSGLNRTQRYITKSKYRWFFPYGVPVHCIWHMACQTICSMKKYHKFCTDNGFVSKSGNIQTSAEVVYRFLTDNPDFEEEHKGLEDVLIEAYIFSECIRKHKRMNRNINRACWRIPQRKN